MENNNSDSSDKADSTVTAVQTTIKQQRKQTPQTLVYCIILTNYTKTASALPARRVWIAQSS